MGSALPNPLIPSSQGAFYSRLAAEVAPRKIVTVSEWADAHRILSSKASSQPGKYRTSKTPHLRAIMDDLSAHSPVQRVTVKKPAQGGVTELALNWVGYVMDERPAPMLVVLPTLEVRERWVKQRLNPMLTDTPRLAALLDVSRTRDNSNTEGLKDFPGGILILGGANSPASLASMPICYVVLDELNRFPWSVGKEGDPLILIDERTKAFARRKVLLISTPTVKGESRISDEYQLSDQRRLLVPCPHCGTYIELTWKHQDETLGLEESKTTGRVWYICRSCGAGIEEHSKPVMLAEHRWQARFPERTLHHGYHWNGLYTPIGLGFTWREMLDQWKAAQDDSTKLTGFRNTELAEDDEIEGDSIDDVSLLARVESYDSPPAVDLVVAGVDIQKGRIEFTAYGFRAHLLPNGKPDDEEAWALDHVVVPGDTTEAQVWEDLDEALSAAGVQLAGIDAGYNTQKVNAYVEKRSWCVALKGVEGMNRPIVEDERKRRQRLRLRRKRGVPQEPIGVDSAKVTLYARLRKEHKGAGYIHYPDSAAFDAEFFAQLTAEKLVTKIRRKRPYQEWVKQRPRNEALDCAIYAIATYQLAGILIPRARPACAGAIAPPPAPADVPRGTETAAQPFTGFFGGRR